VLSRDRRQENDTMSGPAALFREIHRLHRFAADLREQIERTPRQIKAHQTRLAQLEQAQRDDQEALKKLKVTLHEKEVSLKATGEHLRKWERQLGDIMSKKEYDALQAEIAHARARVDQLEEEIFAGMAEAEERAAKLPETDRGVQKAREEFAAYEAAARKRVGEQQGMLAETTAKLKELEKEIPDKHRATYDRVVGAMGADAFAAARGRTCSGCRTEMTAQNYNDLRSSAVVVCRSCERILYPSE
jgi:predicted  nucleic acid-binding Zn-ribbon protein